MTDDFVPEESSPGASSVSSRSCERSALEAPTGPESDASKDRVEGIFKRTRRSPGAGPVQGKVVNFAYGDRSLGGKPTGMSGSTKLVTTISAESRELGGAASEPAPVRLRARIPVRLAELLAEELGFGQEPEPLSFRKRHRNLYMSCSP